MTIGKVKDGSKLTVSVSGRLDTMTSPELQKDLDLSLDGVTDLILDFSSLEYISSTGLRILLYLQKKMAKEGSMKVVNVNEDVMTVFDVTGFSDVLTIE
ncbi:MAG: STAS domain-containing protein [Treponema sp.]|nr:STAS domain-containing protein [Treponema sp.]